MPRLPKFISHTWMPILLLHGGVMANDSPAPATEMLSLEQAMTRLEEQSLATRILELRAEEAAAERKAAGALRNPELRGGGEILDDGGTEYTEWSLGVQKSFAHPGVYRQRLREAGYRYEAEKLRLAEHAMQARHALRETYLAAQLARREVQALQTLLTLADSMENSGEARFAEQTIAAFELFRLSSARLRIQKRLDERSAQAAFLSHRLGSWLYFDSSVSVIPDTVLISVAPLDTAEVLKRLQEKSPRLLVLDKETRAAEAAAKAFRLFPEWSLGGGWKRQSDGVQGIHFEAALPLPLLHWNRNEHRAAEARARRSELELARGRAELRNDLQKFLARWRQTSERLQSSRELLERHPFEYLATALEASYLEGDKSAFEVLDGLFTLYETLELHHEDRILQEQLRNRVQLFLGENAP